MKKFSVLIFTIFMCGAQAAFSLSDSVSPELEQSLKTHSNEPNFMTILFALIVVIGLIYITGLIYSKLNIVGARTVQAQMKNYDLSHVVVVATTQLGQGKNLHVIELNNKRYLIGATTNSINLIKELGEVKKDESLNAEKPSEEDIDAAIKVLYNKDQSEPEEESEPVEEFDVHKKYL